MDTRTGEIHHGELNDIREQLGHDDVVPIEEKDLTEKQRREGKVSLHDHVSKLGKVLTANQRRKRRRRLRDE